MLATSAYMIVFRIVHIVAGVAWAGSLVLLVNFIQPSAKAIGPAAGPFMMELLGKRRVINAILGMAAVTILGGLFLYWHDWHLYDDGFSGFVKSRFGLVITIGAVLAIVAFLIGLFAVRPRVERMVALNRQAAAAGEPPPPEVPKLQGELRQLSLTGFTLVTLAVIAMATARYW